MTVSGFFVRSDFSKSVMSLTIQEAIGRAETELVTCTHDDPTLLALAYAALAIAKALAEMNDRQHYRPEPLT